MRALAALIAASAMLLVPPAAADHGDMSCAQSGEDLWTCEFVCHAGESLRVEARTTGPVPSQEWPRLRATCGGVSVACQANAGCAATSSATAREDGVGICQSETIRVEGRCSAFIAPPPPPPPPPPALPPPREEGEIRRHGFNEIWTPHLAPRDVGFPGAPTTCAPADVVCVGPLAPIVVVRTPDVEAQRLAPYTLIIVGARAEGPAPATTSVGPVSVLGEPFPVDVCEDTCAVPTGVAEGPSAEAWLIQWHTDGTSEETRVGLP